MTFENGSETTTLKVQTAAADCNNTSAGQLWPSNKGLAAKEDAFAREDAYSREDAFLREFTNDEDMPSVGSFVVSNKEERAYSRRERQVSAKEHPSIIKAQLQDSSIDKPKLYSLNRTQCLKRGKRSRLPPNAQFSKSFKLFQEISWKKPDWFLPLHVKKSSSSGSSPMGSKATIRNHLAIPAHLKGKALVRQGDTYTFKPIFDNAYELGVLMASRGLSYTFFRKAQKPVTKNSSASPYFNPLYQPLFWEMSISQVFCQCLLLWNDRRLRAKM